jgi:hypothetical protein
MLCLSFLLVCCCLTTLEAAEPQEYLVPAGAIGLRGVEGRLDHLAVDAEGKRLFVAALENHTVEVLDLAKGKRVNILAGIKEPQGLAFVAASQRLIVCSRGDGICRSLDAKTWEDPLLLDNIFIGPEPKEPVVRHAGLEDGIEAVLTGVAVHRSAN